MQGNQKTYSRQIWSIYWGHRRNRWVVRLLGMFVFVAIFGDFIANERPLYAKIDGQKSFPVLKSIAIKWNLHAADAQDFNQDWKNLEYEAVHFPLIPYSANTIDRDNMRLVSPTGTQQLKSWRWRHWLGTDEIGKDMAAGLIQGTQTAMLVGLIAMSIATLLGLFFGLLAGYYGDDRLSCQILQVILPILSLPLAWFYGFTTRHYALQEGPFFPQLVWSLLIFLGFVSLAYLLGTILSRIPFLQKKISLPLDTMIMRLVEVVNSLPGLLLILAFLAILDEASIIYVMVVIGLISWTSITRFIRAELLKIRDMEYIQAARIMGFSDLRILFRHALPNGLRPVLITLSFGMAGAILLEAFLSFLGIGLPVDTVTWGSLMRKIQTNASTGAWWIAVFPGMAIFTTVSLFNLIGEGLSDALDPQQGKSLMFWKKKPSKTKTS